MMRRGETVFVPMGCKFNRFGISEPVMKTGVSLTISWRFFFAGESASSEVATMLVASKMAPCEVNDERIKKTTRAQPRCKISKLLRQEAR